MPSHVHNLGVITELAPQESEAARVDRICKTQKLVHEQPFCTEKKSLL